MFPSTREQALRRLEEFVAVSGRYARERNHVRPGHPNVSRLSPAIRHRLVTESEVAAAPLGRYAFSTVEKFLQEIHWRRYWKAWLSLRPQVWTAYLADLAELRSEPRFEKSSRRAAQAAEGLASLPVIDHFATELTSTGYLHNHARMWFAAWWIHVERLPWQLGAEFFFRHLLDGDPASNTLSWRWVAGLQTPGKTYLPRRSNIEKFLDPTILDPTGLEALEQPRAYLPETIEKPVITQAELPSLPADPALPTGLWIHEEDLLPEHSPLAELPAPASVLVAGHRFGWSLHGYATPKLHWLRTALDDAAERCRAHFNCEVHRIDGEDLAHTLLTWARQGGLRQIAALRPEPGPLNEAIPALLSACEAEGVRLALLDRPEDLAFRPLATGGFFNFWKKIAGRLRP